MVTGAPVARGCPARQQTPSVSEVSANTLRSLARWSDWLPHSTDDGSRNPQRIRPERYVRPTCFPFAEFNGWATAAYFDVNAGELGTPAVIAYQHDPDATYVVADSLAAFLSRSNALLEEHARDLLFVDGRPSVFSPKRLHVAADDTTKDVSLSNDIDAIGVIVQGLVDVELAKTSIVVPGSALDQSGLKDGLPLIREYLQHGEFGIAFEHVLYMIRELALPIPTETYAVMKRVARAMEIADDKLTGVKSR